MMSTISFGSSTPPLPPQIPAPTPEAIAKELEKMTTSGPALPSALLQDSFSKQAPAAETATAAQSKPGAESPEKK